MKKLIRMNVELKRGFLGDPLCVFFFFLISKIINGGGAIS